MSAEKRKRDYTADMVKEACNDATENGMTIRGSARLHNVPESTLRRRLGDTREADEWKLGGPTYFSPSQEAQLAQHCVDMADKGYGYTRWQILEIAANISDAKGNKITPTKHWFYGFLSRFPHK